MDRRIIRLTVEYDGSAYCGVQRQAHAPSIQSALEDALSQVADSAVTVALAGRTDTGVHATAQVVSFEVPESAMNRPLRAWQLGGNRHLAKDIAIVDADEPEDAKFTEDGKGPFHARFSALARRYLYLLSESVPERGLNFKRFWHLGRSMDTGAMQRSLAAILGERDFTAFRSASCNSPSAFRNVMHARVSRRGALVVCDFKANAFLHRMVRMLTGVLVPIGAGRAPESSIADALRDGGFDAAAMPTAPAHGLYLCGVDYHDRQIFRLPSALLASGESDTIRTP